MTELENYQIKVEALGYYVAKQSDPNQGQYVFAYTITLKNLGMQPAKLISRHWIITDANGDVQEVQGIGVVGIQPHLQPGETYQYTSGAVLNTPVGSMQGSYEMLADDGSRFYAEIPLFNLTKPDILH